MNISPYINFKGDCHAAFTVYKDVLGGDLNVSLFSDAPEDMDLPEGWGDKVMHCSLDFGGGNSLMGSDAPPGMQSDIAGAWVSLQLTDPAEAERIYAALSKDGDIQMQLDKTFWAQRFGTFRDRFGVNWMINCA